MTPSRLLLARHGETDWNRQGLWQGERDIPLNDTGREQSRALARRLAAERIDALHASDLVRASESATIIGNEIGLTPVLSAHWREIRLGELAGVSNDSIRHQYPELVSATARAGTPLAPGAETYAEIEARLRAGFDAICQSHPGETVLVIGHGGTLKALIAMLIGLPPTAIEHLSLRGNTSLSELDFRHGRPQLTMLNDTRHHT
jgi:broad specificity phosphatase PhoE